MTKDEATKIVVRFASVLADLDDANPDVGMSPSLQNLIDMALINLDFDRHQIDFERALIDLRADRRGERR